MGFLSSLQRDLDKSLEILDDRIRFGVADFADAASSWLHDVSSWTQRKPDTTDFSDTPLPPPSALPPWNATRNLSPFRSFDADESPDSRAYAPPVTGARPPAAFGSAKLNITIHTHTLAPEYMWFG